MPAICRTEAYSRGIIIIFINNIIKLPQFQRKIPPKNQVSSGDFMFFIHRHLSITSLFPESEVSKPDTASVCQRALWTGEEAPEQVMYDTLAKEFEE